MFYERSLCLDCSGFQKRFEHILPIFAHCWMLQALCLGALYIFILTEMFRALINDICLQQKANEILLGFIFINSWLQ